MAESSTNEPSKTAEALGLDEAREQGVPGGSGSRISANASGARWRGVQREWGRMELFTHDQARSCAYHWGENGLTGLSDDHQRYVLRWRDAHKSRFGAHLHRMSAISSIRLRVILDRDARF